MASKKPVSKAEVTPKVVRSYTGRKNLVPGFKGYRPEGTRGEKRHLSQQQELFCLRLAILNNATQAARDAGYSQKTPGSMARQLLLKPHVRARVDELRASLKSASVMAVNERKEKLTEFARSGNPLLVNPISAIAELNKMEHVYEQGVAATNQTINILVGSEEVKQLTQRLLAGDRTLPPGKEV